MPGRNRETVLKIAVGVVAGLLLLDRVVFGPVVESWKNQSERLSLLKAKVARGRQLMEREKSIRSRWSEMLRSDLPEDHSAAEDEVLKAAGRWASASRVSFTNLTPQWRPHEGGYDTFECRAQASGTQATLGRMLYEIEADALPMRIEECEFSARDSKGEQLALSLRFSAVRIDEKARSSR